MKNKIRIVAESLLGRCLTEEDGKNISEIESKEKSLGLIFPSALREFYLLVGDLDIFLSEPSTFVEPYMRDGKLVFMEETNFVCYWGVNIDDIKNSTVYRYDIEVDIEWHHTKQTLIDFLTNVMYCVCAERGYKFYSSKSESDYENKDKYLEFLANLTIDYKKVVEHDGFVLFQSGGKLIRSFIEEKGSIGDAIYVSARTAEDMKELETYGFINEYEEMLIIEQQLELEQSNILL